MERARDDAKRAERVTRHHLSKFLLRHGRIYTGKTNWRQAHLAWIARQTFDQPASMQVLSDYREAVDLATARVERLTARLGELAATWDRAPLVKALQPHRGEEMISSETLVAEIFDFRRFATASDLMAYVGLVPSENSSGSSRLLGGITKTGNGHVRRILIESAWHYRRATRMTKALRARNEGVRPRFAPSPGRPSNDSTRGSRSCRLGVSPATRRWRRWRGIWWDSSGLSPSRRLYYSTDSSYVNMIISILHAAQEAVGSLQAHEAGGGARELLGSIRADRCEHDF